MECPILSMEEVSDSEAFLEIAKKFEACYKKPPSFYVRVPGRVNLIGEHIDYCGFAVLPMAIKHDIVIAVGRNLDNKLSIINFDSNQYKISFSESAYSSPSLHNTSEEKSPPWYNYVLCGYKAMYDEFKLTEPYLDMIVKGTIPPASGLSSSSALVCSSALAVSHANNLHLKKTVLASLCAKAERYIGTEGGGMDQAIAFLAEPGFAKLIEFRPKLNATDVPIPQNVVFVVANSCEIMNKAASCQFNIRVVECRLATKMLAKSAGVQWENVKYLSEIPEKMGIQDIAKMTDVVKRVLPKGIILRSEICSYLQISEEEFSNLLSSNTKHLEEFKLADRATHVYEEANRVLAFKKTCEEDEINVIKLGQLMNESHNSCKDLYECSHPVLDELVQIAKGAGALGSRLTGAGWGGCCISMVYKDEVESFKEIVTEKFYKKRGLDADSSMFVTESCGGANVISTACDHQEIFIQ